MRVNYYLFLIAVCFLSFTHSSSAQSDSLSHPYDVINYQLSLDLYKNYTDPFPLDFAANEGIKLVADSSMDTLHLNASAVSLTVDSVLTDGKAFSQVTNDLKITLRKRFRVGDTINLKIYYHHKDKIDLAFYAGKKYVFTDCEPEGARHWFPCSDIPSDKATFDIITKVPSDAQLASAGSLIDSSVVADTVYYHWNSRDPVATYLVALVSRKNYKIDVFHWHPLLRPADSIPVRFYYGSDENPSAVESSFDSMLNYLSESFGDYPFEKVAFASASSYFKGDGMENQTLITVCTDCWNQSLAFRELMHQWFGDLITPKTWADIWLNEGFTQYGVALWAEHTLGSAAARDSVENFRDIYFAGNPGTPIYDSAWAINPPSKATLVSEPLQRCKGACVVDQLRYVLGDSVFFGLLKAYTTDADFRFKNASVGDFMNFTNAYTGGNYDWFFNEWLLQPNHPVYYIVTSITNPIIGEWDVSETINQIKSDSTFFEMPVELKMNFADGTDTTITVLNDVNHQVFDFTFSKQVNSVTFDPDDRIVLKEFGIPTAVNDPAAQASWSFVAPNPTHDNITLHYNLQHFSPIEISVYDIRGTRMKVIKMTSQNAGWHQMNISCEHLSPGVYYCKLQQNEASTVLRFEVVK